MSIGKLGKFEELNTLPNVFQNFDYHHPTLINCESKKVDFKGSWREQVFKNSHPLVLELACGKAEYTVGLAQLFPEKNFIGIDLKGNRMWHGAKQALKLDLHHIAFLRTKIELITHFFGAQEVDEIWITFPDPFLKHTKANRRLTSPFFLDKYRQICKKEAVIHLKTDDTMLFKFSLKTATEQGCEILEKISDLYQAETVSEALSIKTYYEKMHLDNGRTIKYLKFLLK